jgi:hypothetical protein
MLVFSSLNFNPLCCVFYLCKKPLHKVWDLEISCYDRHFIVPVVRESEREAQQSFHYEQLNSASCDVTAFIH